MNQPSHKPSALLRKDYAHRNSGFTLLELLVVIGIIVLLVSILLPVGGRIRQAARVSNTTSFISQLSHAIDNYYNDFHDYPGPLSNTQVWNNKTVTSGLILIDPAITSASPQVYANDPLNSQKITMSENLVLGLLGGLRVNSGQLYYDPRLVDSGAGPNSLNSLATPGAPSKHYNAYIEPQSLSWRSNGAIPSLKTGQFKDDAGSADDTIIPEFVDQFADPLPFLYLRARRGAVATGSVSQTNNTVVTYDPNDDSRNGQYDLHQVMGYTTTKIGVGRTGNSKKRYTTGWKGLNVVHGLQASTLDPIDPLSTDKDPAPNATLTYRYPFDPYVYLRNMSLSSPPDTDSGYLNVGQARNDVPYQKDAYILISPGPDRIYGTEDDITNFGPVGGQ